jgi:hypothetical protein
LERAAQVWLRQLVETQGQNLFLVPSLPMAALAARQTGQELLRAVPVVPLLTQTPQLAAAQAIAVARVAALPRL